MVEILLVEDSRGDANLVMEVLKESKIRNHVSHVEDGEQAMDFLKQRGKYPNVKRPQLILLDLNMPKKDGREVLAEIKADEELKSIPVVVMTTSKSEEDIFKSYSLHANCFVQKPLDFDQFVRIVHNIEEFWFHIVRLPNQP